MAQPIDCRRFLELLDEHLAGRLGAEARGEVEQHLDRCAPCRGFVRIDAELGFAELQPPADFAASVLERTSGSPCASARGRLCGFVDAELDPVDDGLVRMHVSTCAGCRGIDAALRRLSLDLPGLAQLQPDATFVADVLARTLPARSPAPDRLEPWIAAWRRLFQRPRFAMEGAYVGTFVLVLVFGVTGSPILALPATAFELLRVNPVTEARTPLTRIEQQLSESVGSWWDSVSEEFERNSRVAANRTTAFSGRLVEKFKSDAGTILERFASMPETNEPERSTDDDQRTDGEAP